MNHGRGFTLIELAIVLVIITFLIGGLAMPLSAQIQARRVAETHKTLEEAREAIIGFSRTRGTTRYLPCPDTDGDGIENRSGLVCDQQEGWLPWVTLGIGRQDAWNNRLRYEADPAFTIKSGFTESTSLASVPKNIEICASSACSSPIPEIVYVVISHGPNGSGALTVNGVTRPAPAGTDEADNLDANRNYVSHEPTIASATSGEFDDMVVWISISQFFPRACPSGCP